MNRCKRILLLLLVVAVLGVVVWYVWTPEPGVTVANFDRLRAEMTTEQVDHLFGGPCDEQVPGEPGEFVDHMRMWRQGEDVIRVLFTQQGKVCGGTATFGGRSAVLVDHPSLLETLSRMVRR